MRPDAVQMRKLIFQISQIRKKKRLANSKRRLGFSEQVGILSFRSGYLAKCVCVVLHYIKHQSDSEDEESRNSGDTSNA